MAATRETRRMALVETDLAALARATEATERLHALSLRLCFKRPTIEDIEGMRGDLQDIVTILALVRLWLPKERE